MFSSLKLREDALAIWQAGLDAVRSDQLVRNAMRRDGDELTVCDQRIHLPDVQRIAVVGAGKAGAGMASAVEEVLGTKWLDTKVVGWINVPDDCVRPLHKIHLHPARPAGVNEPTQAGVDGAGEILRIVGELRDKDLCLVLISGGGSALLPAPREPITLAEKQSVTRFLMQAGATITELNIVRKQLSAIKGGQLASACRAGSLIALIISDVIGDPLDTIASGPTVADTSTASDALAVLKKFNAETVIAERVFESLRGRQANSHGCGEFPSHTSNHIIGNIQTAIDAARARAGDLEYDVVSLGAANAGDVNQQGQAIAERCLRIRNGEDQLKPPICLLSGGEPVVQIANTNKPRKGGRNQQLVLAAVDRLLADGMERIAILSAGTDGEDGPTDAAGAFADADLVSMIRAKQLDPRSYLAINDSYTFFQQAGGLLKTGPTHTNVMDLRVGLVGSSRK